MCLYNLCFVLEMLGNFWRATGFQTPVIYKDVTPTEIIQVLKHQVVQNFHYFLTLWISVASSRSQSVTEISEPGFAIL